MSRVAGHNVRMQTLFTGHSVKPDTCQLSHALEPCNASGGRPAWADWLHGRSCTPGRRSTWPAPQAAPLAITRHGHIYVRLITYMNTEHCHDIHSPRSPSSPYAHLCGKHARALWSPCLGRSVASALVHARPTIGSPSAASCAACRYAALAMAAAWMHDAVTP